MILTCGYCGSVMFGPPTAISRAYCSEAHARAALGASKGGSGSGCCAAALVRGKHRLALRLARRWLRSRLAAAVA